MGSPVGIVGPVPKAQPVQGASYSSSSSSSSSNPATQSDGVLECGSIAPIRIAPRMRGVGGAERADENSSRFASIHDIVPHLAQLSAAPLGRVFFGGNPGLKPRAESCSPFGTKGMILFETNPYVFPGTVTSMTCSRLSSTNGTVSPEISFPSKRVLDASADLMILI